MDIGLLLKGKKAWEKFTAAHPQFPAFLNDVKKHGVPEGTMVDIRLRYPDGTELKAGLCVKQSDLELIQMLRELRQ